MRTLAAPQLIYLTHAPSSKIITKNLAASDDSKRCTLIFTFFLVKGASYVVHALMKYRDFHTSQRFVFKTTLAHLKFSLTQSCSQIIVTLHTFENNFYHTACETACFPLTLSLILSSD